MLGGWIIVSQHIDERMGGRKIRSHGDIRAWSRNCVSLQS